VKVGDLVTGKKGGLAHTYADTVGVIYDFDEDNDPIVFWGGNASYDILSDCGEYRSSLRVINESR
jgi:hypothetical protein